MFWQGRSWNNWQGWHRRGWDYWLARLGQMARLGQLAQLGQLARLGRCMYVAKENGEALALTWLGLARLRWLDPCL